MYNIGKQAEGSIQVSRNDKLTHTVTGAANAPEYLLTLSYIVSLADVLEILQGRLGEKFHQQLPNESGPHLNSHMAILQNIF